MQIYRDFKENDDQAFRVVLRRLKKTGINREKNSELFRICAEAPLLSITQQKEEK